MEWFGIKFVGLNPENARKLPDQRCDERGNYQRTGSGEDRDFLRDLCHRPVSTGRDQEPAEPSCSERRVLGRELIAKIHPVSHRIVTSAALARTAADFLEMAINNDQPFHEFRSELWLPRPRTEVFAFFGDATNLDAITPPWLSFCTITPAPFEMHVGQLIDYRLRLRGIPIRWRTKITAWEPPGRFVDEQIRGPYRMWIHEHTFESRDGGTLVRDHVRYSVPFDFLVHRWLVRPDIERIFEYRSRQLRERFGSECSNIDNGQHSDDVGNRCV